MNFFIQRSELGDLYEKVAAGQSIVYGEPIDPDAAIAALDAVTIEEVTEVARDVADTLAIACVGPHTADEFD